MTSPNPIRRKIFIVREHKRCPVYWTAVDYVEACLRVVDHDAECRTRRMMLADEIECAQLDGAAEPKEDAA